MITACCLNYRSAPSCGGRESSSIYIYETGMNAESLRLVSYTRGSYCLNDLVPSSYVGALPVAIKLFLTLFSSPYMFSTVPFSVKL